MIRTFTSPPFSFFHFYVPWLLFVSNLRVLSRLGEPSGSSAALRGSVGHSKADIPCWRLVVYIGERVQADGKGFSGRRTVLLWRVIPVGSFPHTADLVAGRGSLRTHRCRSCSGAGGSGRRLGAGNPGCRPAEGVLWRLAVGCRWRRRRRPASDVDECLALWPAHPATDPRWYSPVRDGAALSRF